MLKPVNENRKGYKKTPVGWIPDDWEVKELSDLGSFSKGSGITKEDLVEEGIPCIRYGEIYTTHDYIIKQFHSYISDIIAKSSKLIKCGDVLFAGSGETLEDIGKAVTYIGEDIAYAGGDVIILSVKNISDSVFLSYLLNSQQIIRQKRKLGQGHSVVHIYAKDLGKLLIPYPGLKEKTKIAKLLSLWDIGIENTQKLVELKEKQKKALMQQLLSGKKRLKGFNEKWNRIPSGRVFRSISKKGFNEETLLSVTQDKGVIPRNMLEARVTMPTGERNSFKKVEEGDFVISLRSFQGGIEYSKYKGIVSPAYTVLKPVINIDRDFYRFYFKSYDFIGHLSIAVIGIRDGKQISYDDFCIVKIPYPSYEEQCAVSQILQDAEKEINLLKQKLDSLKKQKKSLMQTLLTGKVRVNTT